MKLQRATAFSRRTGPEIAPDFSALSDAYRGETPKGLLLRVVIALCYGIKVRGPQVARSTLFSDPRKTKTKKTEYYLYIHIIKLQVETHKHIVTKYICCYILFFYIFFLDNFISSALRIIAEMCTFYSHLEPERNKNNTTIVRDKNIYSS